MREWMAVKC